MYRITKKIGKIEKKKIIFLIPQLLFSAQKRERTVKKRKEKSNKKIKSKRRVIFFCNKDWVNQ